VGLGTERPLVTSDEASELRARVARSVQDLRSRSGRSLADVAAAAGIGKSTLHAIEMGEANPGIETLWALARALGVPFGDLLDPPAPVVRVVRAGEGPRVDSESSGMRAHLLATTAHRARVEVYTLDFGPGRERGADAHTAGTVEHVLVTRGRLRVGPTAAPAELEPGDLASFPGDLEHVYEALEPETQAVLVIEYR
jgi:DNA-binding XRE family transcriptional regulator/quercetin dioxygenase-like cupin family protein